MSTTATGANVKDLFARLIKLFVFWGPIIVGFVHQALMYLFCIDRIYVFLTPPEYISPFVTLEIQWWLVLTAVTATVVVLTARGSLNPHRLLYPAYAYLLYLLIFVKPIEPLALYCT